MVLRLRRFFDVRPGEGLRVLFSFLYVAVVAAAFVLAKPLRNGLFLNRYGAYALIIKPFNRTELQTVVAEALGTEK